MPTGSGITGDGERPCQASSTILPRLHGKPTRNRTFQDSEGQCTDTAEAWLVKRKGKAWCCMGVISNQLASRLRKAKRQRDKLRWQAAADFAPVPARRGAKICVLLEGKISRLSKLYSG